MNMHAPADSMQIGNGPATIKAQKLVGRARFAHVMYEQDELIEEIEDSFVTNTTFRKRYADLMAALEECFSDFEIKKSSKPAPEKEQGLFAMPSLIHTAVYSMRVLSTDAATHTATFSSPTGSIQVRDGEIQFVPAVDDKKSKGDKIVNKEVTFEDAFNALVLASTNKSMVSPNFLLIEGGSPKEQAMYMLAVEAFNASVTPDLRFRLKDSLSADFVAEYSVKDDFQAYMNRSVPLQNAPGQNEKPASQTDQNSLDPDVVAAIREKIALPLTGLKISDNDLNAYWDALGPASKQEILDSIEKNKTREVSAEQAVDASADAQEVPKDTLLLKEEWRVNGKPHPEESESAPADAAADAETPDGEREKAATLSSVSSFSEPKTAATNTPRRILDMFQNIFGKATAPPAADRPPARQHETKASGPTPGAGTMG